MNMYKLTLSDKTEYTGDWKEISEQKRVKYQDGFKTVYVCNLSASKISIWVDDLETEMDIPDGCQVYKAMRGQAILANGETKNDLVGICIGLVKDNEVVEERVLNIYEGVIQGWRK